MNRLNLCLGTAAAVLTLTGCVTERRTVPPQAPPPADSALPGLSSPRADATATNRKRSEASLVAEEQKAALTIIALERAALDRWTKGDPSGFLDISAPDISYYDASVPRRLDGLAALTRLYEGLRGQVNIPTFNMLDPKVQVTGQVAVLTYNFVSHGNERYPRWNCTEVYRKDPPGWRIIHTHWSVTQPFK